MAETKSKKVAKTSKSAAKKAPAAKAAKKDKDGNVYFKWTGQEHLSFTMKGTGSPVCLRPGQINKCSEDAWKRLPEVLGKDRVKHLECLDGHPGGADADVHVLEGTKEKKDGPKGTDSVA